MTPRLPPPASLQSAAQSVTATAMHCQPAQPRAPQCRLPPASAPSMVQCLPCLRQPPQRTPRAALRALQVVMSSGPGSSGGGEGRRERAVIPTGPTPLRGRGMWQAPALGTGGPACLGLAAWPWASPSPPAPELAGELCWLEHAGSSPWGLLRVRQGK